jgi:hypothetical protein
VRLFVKSLRSGGLIAAIIAAGVLVGRWNIRIREKAPQIVLDSSEVPAVASALPVQSVSGIQKFQSSDALGHSAPAAPADLDLVTNWEEQVESILDSPTSDSEKAAALLEIFPRLPEGGQSEVAASLSPLLPDSQFGELGKYLTNATTAEPVMDVLMAGLLNRPDAIKLPWLLDMARTEDNPRSADAIHLLQAMLEQDNGKDWQLWQAGVERYLQTNPE